MQTQLREEQEILQTISHLHFKIYLAKSPLGNMSQIHSFQQGWNHPTSFK